MGCSPQRLVARSEVGIEQECLGYFERTRFNDPMALRRQKGSKAVSFDRELRESWVKANLETLLGSGVLIVVGFLIFLPAMHGSWLWDDNLYIVDNALIHSSDGYWKAWLNLNPLGSHYAGNYNPLTTLVEWIEWRLWGNDTLGYHLVSVALHITSALILWRLFSRLGFAFAWVGAMIFLTHPMQVESVTWISELKNTLSLPPLLMAMLAWLDFEEKREWDIYRSAVVWFALSLAAKSSGIMLPIALLGYAWWKKGKIAWWDLKITMPFFVVSLIVGLIMLIPPHLAGAHLIVQPSWHLAPCLVSVGWTIVFLLGKCFLPVGLLPQYPGFSILHPTVFDFTPWLIIFVLSLVLGMGWRYAPWTRPAALGLGFFVLNLVPVLILVGVTYADAAWTMDHLVYVPVIGLIGWGLAWLGYVQAWVSRPAHLGLGAGIGVLLVIFSWGSYVYAGIFVDQDTFWTYMMEREPQNWRVHDNFGGLELHEKHVSLAIEQFRKAIELKPDSDQAHYDLGIALYQEGKLEEAKEHFLLAESLNPHEMRSYLALATMVQDQGNYEEAEKYITQARLAAPNESTPVAALAELRMRTGHKTEALALYAEAIEMTPDVLELRYDYGVALSEDRQFTKAVEQLQAAVKLNDNFAPARENLGVALAQLVEMPDAIKQFKAALRINPDYLRARDNLGLAYAQTGYLEAAIDQFQKALLIDPNDAIARDCLAKLLSVQAAQAAKNPTPQTQP